MKRLFTLFLLLFFLYPLAIDAGFFSPDAKVVKRQIPKMDIDYEKSSALCLLNDIREAMGMNALYHNDTLARAAEAHARYLVRNRVTSHSEIPGFPGFTGKTPAERALHAGYLSTQVLENLSTKNIDAQTSIDGLFSAIYHRFGFLNVGIDEIGVGVAQDNKERENTAFVYLMGNSELNALCKAPPFRGYGQYVYGVCKNKEHWIAYKRFNEAQNDVKEHNPKVVFYPYDGQTDVPPAFYSEIPDPLPDYDVSGFPVSVLFNDFYFKKVSIESFRLYNVKHGKAVNLTRLLSKESDPNARFNHFEFALFPLKRLEYDTTYRAVLVYREKGKRIEHQWQFHTRKPLEQMIRIEKREMSIDLKRGKSYWLYFVPLNGHELIRHIEFPEKVNVTFIDNNTLRVTPMPGAPRSFDIKSEHRLVHVRLR